MSYLLKDEKNETLSSHASRRDAQKAAHDTGLDVAHLSVLDESTGDVYNIGTKGWPARLAKKSVGSE